VSVLVARLDKLAAVLGFHVSERSELTFLAMDGGEEPCWSA
jgi:hypothetical protein